ncbi:MAG: SDR family oxidoreductase [Syntrophomonadaceae bacterium]|nr:SDR family oxidoreductase [Syntrophomonadaceae bacterium]
MNLENKNIVVTGASSGIGLELVKAFLSKGCRVVAADKNISKDSLDNENLYPFQGDLSSPEGVENLFTYALQKLGSIDVFVANAGFAYYEKLAEPDWEHISSIFNINYKSVIYSAQKMKQLNGSKPFNFVTTSSGMAILPLPGYALYSSTKAALKGFAEAYRWELDKGQYFQVVYPIATRTQFFKNAGDSPIPWPSQEPGVVAKSIIKGIQKNSNSIYPSKLFYSLSLLDRVLPIIFKLYAYVEYKKFKKWLAHQNK